MANNNDQPPVPTKHVRDIQMRRPPAHGRVTLDIALGVTDRRGREIDTFVQNISETVGDSTVLILDLANKSGQFNDAEWTLLVYSLGLRDHARRQQKGGR